jgi:hypothetical protein
MVDGRKSRQGVRVMKKYDAKAGTAARVEFGVDLGEGLKTFPETADLEPPLTAINEQLDTAFETRRGKQKQLARLRALLRTAEWAAEQEIRTFARAVEVTDSGRQGRTYERLFPNGLVATLLPRRARQVRALAVLLEGLERLSGSDVEALRSQWLPRLRAVHDQLARAVADYETVAAEAQQLFREELRLRVDHERLVDQLIGRVRATFPKDRARQNAVFPAPPHKSARAEAVEPVATVPAQPTAVAPAQPIPPAVAPPASPAQPAVVTPPVP